MQTEFFMPMRPPTATHQEKQVAIRGGKPVLYDPPAVKDARQKFAVYLGPFVPMEPYNRPVRLVVKWLFPLRGRHRDGEYKATRPDTDNLQKLLKDVMTHLRFWRDDALVASEIVEKFWAKVPGIYVRIEELGSRSHERNV